MLECEIYAKQENNNLWPAFLFILVYKRESFKVSFCCCTYRYVSKPETGELNYVRNLDLFPILRGQYYMLFNMVYKSGDEVQKESKMGVVFQWGIIKLGHSV